MRFYMPYVRILRKTHRRSVSNSGASQVQTGEDFSMGETVRKRRLMNPQAPFNEFVTLSLPKMQTRMIRWSG